MWIVRIALQRPYTFVVMALLLAIIGPLTILRTPTDIFPNINIPIVSVVWSYTGLPPNEMADRIVGQFERSVTTTVNDIEHIESQSLTGVSVIKIFFQPHVNLDVALSQVTAISQTQLRQLPPGTTPPLVLSYNASSVPIIQLALSGKTLSEQELFDLGQNFIRTQLATVQGASIPYPYGGKQREAQVDLDQKALQAYGLSAADVNTAIGNQNLILPGGTEKIGLYEYNIRLNGSPLALDDLNNLPVKAVNGTTIYVHDVAHVRDGFPPQQNIVRVDGKRAVLMTIQKTGSASTLQIIDQVKERLPQIQASSPDDLEIRATGDQSIFVSAAVEGVIREGAIAATLTGLMILLFLGSWRSTLIITISIPLSILASLIALSAIGETINIMTLGGLALAVGILVDDATVAIENINYHLEQGKEVEEAILDGAQQIAVPALVSTLCICIVFVPMFLLSGVARYLFVPLAEAVVFAMLASYVLSRTLVPTLAKYWLKKHEAHGSERHDAAPRAAKWSNLATRFQAGFERRFEALRTRYRTLLEQTIERRVLFAMCFGACVLISFALVPFIGDDFFPTVDAGQLKIHIRGHTGLRVEETARLTDQIEGNIRRVIPPEEIDTIVDNIGLPLSGINLSYSNSSPIGSSDADILITLKPDHQPVAGYQDALRAALPRAFPGTTFSFLPADITSQILNFGLPSPIDVEIVGQNKAANRKYAMELLHRMRHITGIADLRIQQAFDDPEFDVDVDRTRAVEIGLTQHDVANDLLISLSGSFQTAPTFWLNTKNDVNYSLVAQTPQYDLQSLDDLRNVPITGTGARQTQILGGLASIRRAVSPGVVSHYNVQDTIDIFASVRDRDLGGVGGDIQKILDDTKNDVPRATRVSSRGQVLTMQSSFTSLYYGILFAILLVYLLIVINFQSWLDPFIITMALPAALAGIVWALFATHTTLSVPALTGAIMSVGVATANSILMVSFARERMDAGDSASVAATEAGFTRLRPVLMTALAMMIGMLPMALGLGEGGEQNAPLGRAVIGGLAFATLATLFFVPVVFVLVHGRRSEPTESPSPMVDEPHHPAHRGWEHAPKTESSGKLWLIGVIVAVLLALIVAWGIVSRISATSRLKAETDEQAIPIVAVTEAKKAPSSEELVLPGNVQANFETPVYARTSGYIKKWYTDIGSPVKAGQVLADIDTPEVDDQLRQAEADLNTAIANNDLAQSTARRWKALLTTDSVARQETDEKVGDATAKAAMVASAKANVARLQQLETFKHVVAPFDGVVTARETDIGALINAGSGAGAELFRVADRSKLRIYIQVPQTYASVVAPGLVVKLKFAEHPGQTYTAKMVRTSEALDPNARTLLVELQADNADGVLLPGGFTEVHLQAPAANPAVRLPVSALLFREEGLRVATVDGDGHAQLHAVTPGRDFGTEIEILTGVEPGQKIILNPPDSLESGEPVKVAASDSKNSKGNDPAGGKSN